MFSKILHANDGSVPAFLFSDVQPHNDLFVLEVVFRGQILQGAIAIADFFSLYGR